MRRASGSRTNGARLAAVALGLAVAHSAAMALARPSIAAIEPPQPAAAAPVVLFGPATVTYQRTGRVVEVPEGELYEIERE